MDLSILVLVVATLMGASQAQAQRAPELLAARGPGAAARPPPDPTPMSERTGPGATEATLVRYMVASKPPEVAWMLSLAPGFGVGHFYAHSYLSGIIFAGGEMLSAGLLGTGVGLNTYTSTDGRALAIVGAALFAVFKAVELAMAPGSAEEYNQAVARRFDITPLEPLVPGRAVRPLPDLPSREAPPPSSDGFSY